MEMKSKMPRKMDSYRGLSKVTRGIDFDSPTAQNRTLFSHMMVTGSQF